MIDSARPRNTLHSPSHCLALSSSVPGSSRSEPYKVDSTHVTIAGSGSIYTDVVQKNLFGSPQLHQLDNWPLLRPFVSWSRRLTATWLGLGQFPPHHCGPIWNRVLFDPNSQQSKEPLDSFRSNYS
ncbi:hypothetical protein KIW84_062535 [Lathyrus oleraceus]|uniref:Uncharacterized protein n=1 Tax=Pisum sativum TaxID=3888 RepID=A0A9D5A3P8_PEA|nr:hypothetical protein KIW84_062535 [Pisum sativum]